MKVHSHPEKFPPGVQKPETDQDIKVSHHHLGTQMLSCMDLALELTLKLQFCTQNGSKPLSPAMNSGGALVYAMGRSTPQLCRERLKGKIDIFFSKSVSGNLQYTARVEHIEFSVVSANRKFVTWKLIFLCGVNTASDPVEINTSR